MLNIELTVDEINVILEVLGKLPTSSGAYPLMMNIKEQAETKLKEQANGTQGN